MHGLQETCFILECDPVKVISYLPVSTRGPKSPRLGLPMGMCGSRLLIGEWHAGWGSLGTSHREEARESLVKRFMLPTAV